jgi:hypothetical protein
MALFIFAPFVFEQCGQTHDRNVIVRLQDTKEKPASTVASFRSSEKADANAKADSLPGMTEKKSKSNRRSFDCVRRNERAELRSGGQVAQEDKSLRRTSCSG